ncbi:MAG TPA: DUF4465 domain-containing protein [Myxococcota bacterium]|nr:DUF4465 domain-containing protein [Myxococcota bacterium]
MLSHALRRSFLSLVLASFWLAPAARALTIDFEDVGANLPIGSSFYYNGSSALPGPTDFTSGGASFNNSFTNFGGGCCWEGFAYSQKTDSTTPGFGNQYSAWPGAGAGGSATYAIGFTGGAVGGSGVSTVDFGADVLLSSVSLTNATYAALSMRDGDGFAKKFGGASGNDPDFLRLTISGLDAFGVEIGSLEFYLADFRFADNGQDYIVDSWVSVDLSGLGPVRGLDFTMDSSDSAFGFLNTPAYFALDDLGYTVVPEPGTGALLALGLAGLRVQRVRGPATRSAARRAAPSAG